MYERFSVLMARISDLLYSYVLVILLLAAGVYFTARTGFVQLRMLGESLRLVGEKKRDASTVSPFQALMVSTASRVGTGNIVGVANAIAIGGYGAVFWMWTVALIGGATAFVESTLAQIYKRRDDRGGSCGGPAYYIEAALGKRWLGVLFSLSLIATYAVGFNMLCAYNVASSFSGYAFYGDADTTKVPLICGGILAVLTGWCVMGGGKRLLGITGTLVPLMGTGYILMALVTMVLNIGTLPMVLREIVTSAFDFRAMLGGFSGSALMQGVKRGLYSNEAGVGSAPNAAAAAEVSHPVKQGLVQMLSVFIDTMLVCTATAMMCLSCGVEPNRELTGAPYVQWALSRNFGDFGVWFVTVSLVLFAFTTLLGNLYYCEGCLRYLAGRPLGKGQMNVFYLAACALIFLGATLEFGLVWDVADVLMGLMTLINLPVILRLAKIAMAALEDYRRQRREGKDPVFVADSIGLEQITDFWT